MTRADADPLTDAARPRDPIATALVASSLRSRPGQSAFTFA